MEVADAEELPYEAVYLERFDQALSLLPNRVYDRVEDVISLLLYMPTLGRPYVPKYSSPKNPAQWMMKYVDQTHCILFYTVDEITRTLTFFYLSDTRQDPATLFGDLN